ncbi:MAG: purine-binding chemotaxis protein CheW [Pirellulales bacterium]|nr:purine-binding chemotaxis protein CheW [Pirellulales bacterium]
MSTVLQEPLQDRGDSEMAGTMQLVSFHLAEETFGVAITKVREIILMCDITRVPQTPHYVKGLINLRNSVIPVIDLRALFGLPESDQAGESRIMVMQVGNRTVGIVVDAVDEVLRISQNQIAPPPPTVASLGNEYLNGLVKLEEQLLILLDIDQILGKEGVALATAAAV